MWDDGNSLGPKEVHSYLTRVMYNRRNKFNPLWNSLVLGGIKNGQKYLGTALRERNGFFGSTLPYKSVERLKPIGKDSLLGASGEISDFQEILKYLDELIWSLSVPSLCSEHYFLYYLRGPLGSYGSTLRYEDASGENFT
ncbi:hypothetical protein V2J09_005724 [Rumex salicifolius]